jgi:hypothetical protein
MNVTLPPRRDAAMAWFAPLPPGFMRKVPPSKVSPGAGNFSVLITMSVLELPIIKIWFIAESFWVPGSRFHRKRPSSGYQDGLSFVQKPEKAFRIRLFSHVRQAWQYILYQK